MSERWDHGQALYALLPVVYRVRDGGDLRGLLETCGELFDRIGETLDQRLADCFPDADGGPDGRSSQEWLLPYFADLVDARVRSPHPEGRRREVAEAIEWRQRKGTLAAAEAIAEAIIGRAPSGLRGREVELREGFRLVATTATLEGPLGDSTRRELTAAIVTPGSGPRRPAATLRVDLPSRAVQVPHDTPGAHSSSFGGPARVSWGVLHPDGVPCFPGAFDDAARRTVDVRDTGHAHSRRLLAHVAPPLGFFRPGHSARRGAPAGAAVQALVEHTADTVLDLRDAHVAKLVIKAGRVRLHGCTVDRVEATPRPAGETAPVLRADGSVLGELSAPVTVRLRHTTVTGAVSLGRISADRCLFTGPSLQTGSARLQRCAARALDASGEVSAARTLLGSLVAGGLAHLEYVTVLGSAALGAGIEASDTLFAGALGVTGKGNVRYSRIPPGLAGLRTYAVTTATPRFAPPGATWDAPGRGVLDSASPAAVRFGAEDGGELGAYHDDAHGLEELALLEQVADHLPYGLQPLLVADARLHRRPPSLTESEDR